MTQQIKYKRVLLKLSGESLMGSDPFGINHDTIVQTVGEIAEIVRMGVQVGIVVGGGNIFRGVSAQAGSMDRATADYMGMMATVMNALALKDAFETLGIKARVQSALSMQQIAETYARPKAIQYLEEGKVVIFAAGTGNTVLHDRHCRRIARCGNELRRDAQSHQRRRRVHRRPEKRPICNTLRNHYF